jgi:3-oxoacyl-[acyl-carrier protein] reductase
MDLGLAGKACVVTGASRGIGRSASKHLVAEGASVLAVDISGDELEASAGEVGAVPLVADVTAPGAAELMVERCADEFGAIDVLVINAGAIEAKSIEDLADPDWNRLWELHVMAAVRTMRLVAPRMAAAGWGRIVVIASTAGRVPTPINAAYSVTKAAQISLARAYADAYGASGVLVNSVLPGPLSGEIWERAGGLADQLSSAGETRSEVLERIATRPLLRRMGEVDEVGAVVAILCSELASYVTGAAWAVDGGTIPTPT